MVLKPASPRGVGGGGGGLEGCQQALLSGELFSHGNGELARRCARKPVTQCQ